MLSRYRVAGGDELRNLRREPTTARHGLLPREPKLAIDDGRSVRMKRGRAFQIRNGREGPVIRRLLGHRHDRQSLLGSEKQTTNRKLGTTTERQQIVTSMQHSMLATPRIFA